MVRLLSFFLDLNSCLSYHAGVSLTFKKRREKMSRKPIIAGNWKMNLLQADAKALFEGIKGFVKDFTA